MSKKLCEECSWLDWDDLLCNNHESVYFLRKMDTDQTCAAFTDGGGDDEELKEFHLVEMPMKQGRNWMLFSEDLDRVYENRHGGKMPSLLDPPISIVGAKNFMGLDWSVTYLSKSGEGAGWLDRAGRFFGCPREEHDAHAELILKSDVYELERRGWVRVNNKTKYQNPKPLSTEQRMWLDRKGYEVEDDGHL